MLTEADVDAIRAEIRGLPPAEQKVVVITRLKDKAPLLAWLAILQPSMDEFLDGINAGMKSC